MTWTGTFTPTDDIEDATNVISVGSVETGKGASTADDVADESNAARFLRLLAEGYSPVVVEDGRFVAAIGRITRTPAMPIWEALMQRPAMNRFLMFFE